MDICASFVVMVIKNGGFYQGFIEMIILLEMKIKLLKMP